MERRSFVATLFAPLLRRFFPVKPVGLIIIGENYFPVGYRERDGMLLLLKELSVEDAQSVLDAMFPQTGSPPDDGAQR